MKGHREQFLAAGMDGYAAKPIRSAEPQAAVAAAGTDRLPFSSR